MPGQKGAETQVLIEVDPTEEGVTVSTVPPKSAPVTVSPEDTDGTEPKQTPAVGVTEVTTVDEAGVEGQAETSDAEKNGVKGLPAGESGATGNLSGRLLRFCMRERRLNSRPFGKLTSMHGRMCTTRSI